MNNREIRNQARLFRALSCEWRLRIVLILYVHDRSVNEIVEDLKTRHPGAVIDRTGVSKHMAVLKKMGIVTCEGAGQKRIYRLEACCLVDAIKCTAKLSKKDVCPVSYKRAV